MRHFLLWFLIWAGGVSGLVFLFEFVETLNDAFKEGTSLRFLAWVALLSLPAQMEEWLPIYVYLATISTFASLDSRGELTPLRALGWSHWDLLAPVMLAAFTLGWLSLFVLNPIGSALLKQQLRLESGARTQDISFQAQPWQDGFWLRQGNPEDSTEQILIRSDRFSADGIRAQGITVVRIHPGGVSTHIQAESAELDGTHWLLRNAWVIPQGERARLEAEVRIPTELTPKILLERRASIEETSWWRLREVIDLREDIGASSLLYRYRFHYLWTLPFFLVALTMFGAVFVLPTGKTRRRFTWWFRPILALVFPYGLLVLTEAVAAWTSVPLVLTTLAPIAAVVAASFAILCHFNHV